MEAILTIPTNIFAFVLGACHGDRNRADAVIECLFFDDQTISDIARIRGVKDRTLRYQVARIRVLLRGSGRVLVDRPPEKPATMLPERGNR